MPLQPLRPHQGLVPQGLPPDGSGRAEAEPQPRELLRRGRTGGLQPGERLADQERPQGGRGVGQDQGGVGIQESHLRQHDVNGHEPDLGRDHQAGHDDVETHVPTRKGQLTEGVGRETGEEELDNENAERRDDAVHEVPDKGSRLPCLGVVFPVGRNRQQAGGKLDDPRQVLQGCCRDPEIREDLDQDDDRQKSHRQRADQRVAAAHGVPLPLRPS